MPKKEFKDTVLKEFKDVGKYKVRLLQSQNDGKVLDIREFIEPSGEGNYTGYTRKGIRIMAHTGEGSEVDTLLQILKSL